MVNAYLAPASSLSAAGSDVEELRRALTTGDYTVPAQAIAEAVLRWHQELDEGRVAHEIAPFPTG